MFVDTRALDIDANVHHMGKSWSQIHSEPLLTCGPVNDLDFKDMVYTNGAAYHDPIMQRVLASAVRDDELRYTRDIARQWKNFILGPAGAASQAVQYTCPGSD